MADNNKITIIDALVRLRNDLKLWVANNLRALSKKIDDHNEDTSAHQDIRDAIITDYSELENAPSITDDEPGKVVYVDPDGNIIAQIDSTGLETANITINNHLITGVDLQFSNESANPVQNKIITEFIKNLVSFDPQDPTTLVIALPTVNDSDVGDSSSEY